MIQPLLALMVKELELLLLLLDNLTFDASDSVPLVPSFVGIRILASSVYYLKAVNPDLHTVVRMAISRSQTSTNL